MHDIRGQRRAEKAFLRRREVRAIRAELVGDSSCSALGMKVSSSSPVLALCRQLVQAGYDPDMPLEAYRGDTLALRVKSIGQAASLQVNSDCTGFERASEHRAALLARPIAEAAECGPSHQTGPESDGWGRGKGGRTFKPSRTSHQNFFCKFLHLKTGQNAEVPENTQHLIDAVDV